MHDETLASISRRSTTYGPRAREILRQRADGLQKDTATLTDLTEQIEADNDSIRPLLADGGQQRPGASSEEQALDELRRLYG